MSMTMEQWSAVLGNQSQALLTRMRAGLAAAEHGWLTVQEVEKQTGIAGRALIERAIAELEEIFPELKKG